MRTRRQHSSSDSMPRPVVEKHIPVLLHEVIELLAIQKSDVVLDATLGGGGHAREILARLGDKGVFVGIDADSATLARAKAELQESSEEKTAHFVSANFRALKTTLETLGIQSINKAIFDLGWNTAQLGSGRGFSFQKDEPLIMTYSDDISNDTITASRVVNEWSEETLADIIFGFGEERYARRIARMIVGRRQQKPFKTARELAEAIRSTVPPSYRHGRIHSATRTFQALRIAVNDELGAIQEGFSAAWEALSRHGRIAFITFHSVEDRLIKRLLREKADLGEGQLLTKRPTKPSREEVEKNPRSRSAKLRGITKMIS